MGTTEVPLSSFGFKEEMERSNVSIVLYLAEKFDHPAIPAELCCHLNDRHTLLHVLYLAHNKLQQAAFHMGFNMGSCLIREHIVWLMLHSGKRMPPPPTLELCPLDLGSQTEGLDPQAPDTFKTLPWTTLTLIMRAFQGAMCALPTSRSSYPAEETLTDAVVPVFVGVIELLLAWWRSEQDEGRSDMPPFLARTLLLCVTTLHSMPYTHRPADHPTNKRLFLTIGNYLPAIVGSVSPAALIPVAPAAQLLQPQTSTRPGGSSNGSSGGKAGNKGKGKGKAGRSQARGKENDRPPDSQGGGGQTAKGQQGSDGHQQQGENSAGGTNSLPEMGADQVLRTTLDLRGLVHACYCAVARGCQVALNSGTMVKVKPLQVLPGPIADHLHTLHVGNKEPITDPCPALKVSAPAGTSSAQALGAGTSTASSSKRTAGSGPGSRRSALNGGQPAAGQPAASQYLPGNIWVPDTFSLGPAPAAVAGAECVGTCFTVNAQEPITTEEVLSTLKFTTTLTQLAQAMVVEASGDNFLSRAKQDPDVLQSWCRTVGAMCDTVMFQLNTLGKLSDHIILDDSPQRFTLRRKPDPKFSVVSPFDIIQGGRIQVWLDPEVIILLPVVNAAALRLAYWALSCVRLTRAIFDGCMPSLRAGDTFHTQARVAAVQLARSAALMYDVLLQWAWADEGAPLPQAAVPSSTSSSSSPPPAAAAPGSTGASAGASKPSSSAAASSSASSSSAAAAVAAGSQAAGSTSAPGRQPQTDVVRKWEVVPPEFYRHCAAVTVWGPNLSSLADIIKVGLLTITQPCMLGDASSLLSWQSGHGASAALFLFIISYVESAASLLLKTGGDLAGWLGDLAPRGDLDSTQLLYRMAGSRLDGIREEMEEGSSKEEHQAVTVAVLPLQAVPMLALAQRMLQPGKLSSTAGAAKKAGTITFYEAWRQSPLTLKTYWSMSSLFDVTVKCASKVISAITAHAERCPDQLTAGKLGFPDGWDDIESLKASLASAGQLFVEQAKKEREPLAMLMMHEQKVWVDTLEAASRYRPKEASEHSQRLHAYVEAAAARAAGQLEPGLKKELYEALRLAA